MLMRNQHGFLHGHDHGHLLLNNNGYVDEMQLRNLNGFLRRQDHGHLSSLNERVCQQPCPRTAPVESEQFSALSGHRRQTQRRACKPRPRTAPFGISTGNTTIGVRNSNCGTSTVFCTSRPENKSCITTGKTTLSKNSTSALSGSTNKHLSLYNDGHALMDEERQLQHITVFCTSGPKPLSNATTGMSSVSKDCTCGIFTGCTVWTATKGMDTTWSKSRTWSISAVCCAVGKTVGTARQQESGWYLLHNNRRKLQDGCRDEHRYVRILRAEAL